MPTSPQDAAHGSAQRNRALLAENDPQIFAALAGEEARQCAGIELIPSENYAYPEVLAALAPCLPTSTPKAIPADATTAARNTPTSSSARHALALASCSVPNTPTCSRFLARR